MRLIEAEAILSDLASQGKTMALIKCPDCGADVSDAAAACPKCARPIAAQVMNQAAQARRSPAAKSKHLSGGSVLFVFIFLGLVIYYFANDSDAPESPKAAAAAPALAQSKHIVGDSFFGCADKDYFSELVGYAVDKDVEAFKKGLRTGMLTGQCTMFKNEDEVFLTDTSIFSGLVQVRRRGDTTAYWTNLEAVK